MTLQYCSDLHLEFQANKQYLIENPIQPKGEILLLAGDIVPFSVMDKHDDFFDYISDHFTTTYWIPGNHEYYNSDISERSGAYFEQIRSNVHLINNKVVIHEGVTLILSTLWTIISEVNRFQVERGMRDFHVIKNRGDYFKTDAYNHLHKNCIRFIQEALASATTEKSIVITHHVPTKINYPEVYKGSLLNEGFAVEFASLIEERSPDAWIYGHHHFNVPDFTIGKTQLLTNQLGYVGRNEHLEFSAAKYFVL